MRARILTALVLTVVATSCVNSSGRAQDEEVTETASMSTASTTPLTPPPASPVEDGLSLEIRADVVDNPDEYEIATRGPFAVWWDPAIAETAETIPDVLDLLADVEADATERLGFGTLPTADAGQYLNVYVHVPGEDRFPDFLGNGLGYSDEGMPYMAMPFGAHEDPGNVRHEAYHAFQSSSEYEVFEDDPDALWIIEASAEWYQQARSDGDPRAFITAGSVHANPHLALWHVPENGRPDDPDDNDWLYGVRQYGVGTFLYYLTEVAGVDRSTVAAIYTTEPDLTAQEHLFDAVGGERFRSVFADWAVRTAAGFDYLTEEQADVAFEELAFFASADEIRSNAATFLDPDAVRFSPPEELAPRSWAYNSILIENSTATTYVIGLDGSPTGSEGGPSRFEARVGIRDSAGEVRFLDVPMSTATTGDISVDVGADDVEIYVVVASVPENFNGTGSYGYELAIARS